jgi:hypothetical protein
VLLLVPQQHQKSFHRVIHDRDIKAAILGIYLLVLSTLQTDFRWPGVMYGLATDGILARRI